MAAENTSKRKAHDGLLGDFFAHGLGHEFTDGRMGLLGLAEELKFWCFRLWKRSGFWDFT